MLTTEELFREYIKLFTLIVETAGQTEGNKSYKEVTEIIEDAILNDIPGNNVVQIIIYRKHYVLEDGTETDYDYDFFKLREK